MENGKTIKQLADEMGVSKTAIRDKIAKLGLQSTLRKIANQFVISQNEETLIKSEFLTEKPQINRKASRKVNTIPLCNSTDNFAPEKTDEKKNVIEVEQTYQDLFNLNLSNEKRVSQLEILAQTQQEKIVFLETELEKTRLELEKERNFSREQSEKIMIITDQSQKLQLAQMNTPILESRSSEQKNKFNLKFWK